MRNDSLSDTTAGIHDDAEEFFLASTWIKDEDLEVGVPTVSEHHHVTLLQFISAAKCPPSIPEN
jgi:hypothetical protein